MRTKILQLALGLGLALSSQFASADGPLSNFSQALDHSTRGLAYASGAGTQAIAATLALPLVVIGKAGQVSAQAGSALQEHVNAPLDIADESPSAHARPRQFAENEPGRIVSPDRALLE